MIIIITTIKPHCQDIGQCIQPYTPSSKAYLLTRLLFKLFKLKGLRHGAKKKHFIVTAELKL